MLAVTADIFKISVVSVVMADMKTSKKEKKRERKRGICICTFAEKRRTHSKVNTM